MPQPTTKRVHPSFGEPMNMSWLDKLEAYLFEANLDDALKFLINDEPSAEAFLSKQSGPKELYARSLICEVLDYAGLWRQATHYIGDAGIKAFSALHGYSNNTSFPSNFHLIKQQCWCCLQLGMVQYYREQQWMEAGQYFETARAILDRIAAIQKGSCVGSLSRAYYCLGLVAREEHDYIASRQHFSKSIELAGKKLDQSRNEDTTRSVSQHHKQSSLQMNSRVPTKFFEYCLAKSSGLGMSWLAYTRGSMSEAFAHLVSARQLLPETGAKYIRSYIDVVYATAKRAASADDEKELTDALHNLRTAYMDLGGDTVLVKARHREKKRDAFSGHRTYAIRAAIELATAYLAAARLSLNLPDSQSDIDHEDGLHLHSAIEKVNLVLSALTVNPQSIALDVKNPQSIALIGTFSAKEIEDPRTYCNALILGSRILREIGHRRATKEKGASSASTASKFYRDALHIADSAALIVKNDQNSNSDQDKDRLHFSHIDSSIACGEAYFHCREYKQALQYFEDVAIDERARTNPKVVAVAELLRATCYVRLDQRTRARDIFQSWQGYGRLGNENAYIRTLEAALTHDLKSHHGILCLEPDRALRPLNKERFDYWWQEVYCWLAREAIRIVKEEEGITDDREAVLKASKKIRVGEATIKRYLEKKWN